jgi:hypothetical protein
MIKEFIFDNKRVPLPGELVASLPSTGNFIMANNESSREETNKIILETLDRQKKIINSLKAKNQQLIKDFNVFNSRAESSLLELKNIERNVNKDLLLFSKSDEFLYSIVEHFNDERNINKELSTNFSVTNGKLTLGYSQVGSEDFIDGDVSYSIRHRIGSSFGEERFSNFSNVLRKDNNFYKTTAYSNIENDIVDFIIDVKFKTAREVNEFMFVIEAIEINSKMKFQCYYTKDGVSYDPVFESDSTIKQNENLISVNQKDITGLKIIISKYNADTKVNNRYGYIFAFDYIGLVRKLYRVDKESTIYLGPYQIINEEGTPIYYSMATLKGGTCCIVEEETSIDFYLSKDNVNWFKADYEVIENDIVMFDSINDNIEDSSIFTRINNTEAFFTSNTIEGISTRPNEKMINYFIENLSRFNLDTLRIKRNSKKAASTAIGDKFNGWKKAGDSIQCYFIVKETEGRYIDFGPRSCILNGNSVTGKVFLKKGKHHISTSQYKFIDAPELIKNISELRRADALYPYNHKYLIEGFDYSSKYNGEKVYQGLSEVYESELKYVNPARFNALSTEYDVYTLIDNKYLVCRFENINNIEKEYFEVESKTRVDGASTSNLLYIKAVLKSVNQNITPKIDQIQVRVI